MMDVACGVTGIPVIVIGSPGAIHAKYMGVSESRGPNIVP